MKKNKVLKIVLVLLVLILCSIQVLNSVYADGSCWDDPTQFDGYNGGSAGTSATSIMGNIIAVIRIVGTGIAVIMIVLLAIKYMSAAPSERADIKKSAIPYVIGAILLFASSNIIGLIRNFATTNVK